MRVKAAVVGANVWAYGGESWELANEKDGGFTPGKLWKPGNTFTGDPPHEAQGWYSIYSKDDSTLDILEKYSECIQPRTQTPRSPLPATIRSTRAMADRQSGLGD